MEGSALIGDIDSDILLTHNLENRKERAILHIDTPWNNIRKLGFLFLII